MKRLKRGFALILTAMIFCICILSHGVDVYAKTKKFNVTKSQMLNTVSKYSVGVMVNGKEQRFKVKKTEVEQFTVKSKKYASKKTKMTVKTTFLVDRTVAKVRVNATLKYELKKNKWKIKNCAITKTSISSISLKGTWKGTYVAGQGQTQTTIVVDEVTKDGFANGTFNFSATPTNPTVPTGSYTFVGGFDKATGKVSFVGSEWIEQPDGYVMIDLYAHIDLIKKKIVDSSYKLSISKA